MIEYYENDDFQKQDRPCSLKQAIDNGYSGPGWYFYTEGYDMLGPYANESSAEYMEDVYFTHLNNPKKFRLCG